MEVTAIGAIDRSEDAPSWYLTLRNIQEAMSAGCSLDLTELQQTCKELVWQADCDLFLDHRIKLRIQAGFAKASAQPRFQLRRALRNFLDEIPPKLHPCQKCGKLRLAVKTLSPLQRLECGSEATVFPARSCKDASDTASEWLSSSAASTVWSNSSPVARTGGELDVLALVAAAEHLKSERLSPKAKDSTPDRSGSKFELSARPPITKGRRSSSRRPTSSSGYEPMDIPDTAPSKPSSPLAPIRTTPSRASKHRQQLVPSPDSFSEAKTGLSPLPRMSPSGTSSFNPVTPQMRLPTTSAHTPTTALQAAPDNLRISIPQSAKTPGAHTPRALRFGSEAFSPIHSIPNKTSLSALGRAISDPQALQRELALGIPPLEEEEAGRLPTAAAVLRAGVDMTAYIPGRPLSRAISDPKKMREQWHQNPADFIMQALLPRGGTLVEWQATVRFVSSQKSLDLFTLVAALPLHIAHSLPIVIPLNSIRPRESIRMDTLIDKPLPLQFGKMDAAQNQAVEQMERSKLVAVAHLPGFDLVLVPHMNSRNLLHIIALRMERGFPAPSEPSPAVAALSRRSSALPDLGKEDLEDAEAQKLHNKASKT